MSVSTCIQCGEVIPEQAKRCPVCGTPVSDTTPLAVPHADPQEFRVQQLVAQARECQNAGDLPLALRHAREALSLRCDECSIHALLGHLYEQTGNKAAARYHFQIALTVSPELTAMEPVLTPEPDTILAHQTRGTWLLLVLIGCVLFSGMAVLFTLIPGERNVGSGFVFHSNNPDKTHRVSEPRWTWKVPSPVHATEQAETPDSVPSDTGTQEKTVLAVGHVESTSTSDSATNETLPLPSQVLGPSASAGVPAETTEPTIEQADQAYFHGKYERAVSIYEELLHHQEKADPRIMQNLAWCYQQLGNSLKAAEYLEKAVQGYQAQLSDDPQNAAAQQGRKSCEAALRSLQSTHETVPTP